jgi:hypothetical protein
VIINGEDNDLDTFDGVGKTAKLYLSWLKQISINLIEVTGNALKLDWAGNFTNSEDSK